MAPQLKKTALWFPNDIDKDVMRTTTQIMLEEGAVAQKKYCVVEKKILNFSSFNMNDPRYGTMKQEEVQISQPMMSSYMRAYTLPYPLQCKPLRPKAELPHPLFNSRPKNQFEKDTGIEYKFLDDHFIETPQARRQIDFFRQIRDHSMAFE